MRDFADGFIKAVMVAYCDRFNVLVVPGWHTFEVMNVWGTCARRLWLLRIAIRQAAC